ncbi:MAG: flagellar basal body rod protein [Acidimicrobiaceae bacterium]|nr:flagellar basal body rod protein [Acidimicrobiaceae bacterium]
MSGVIDILNFAIDGVTQQQNAVANNIANASTPGFTGTEVSFESSLQHALDLPGPATAQVSSAPSSALPATNGNNVQLSDELVAAQSDTLHYQTISESLNAQFRLIQGASGGSYT